MSDFLQLSVKLPVCRYCGVFQTLRTAIRTCKDVSLFVYQTRKRFQKRKSKTESLERIAKELDLQNGKVVEQLWNNFKKLLSKQRTKLKEVDVSGAAAVPVNKALKALEELNYFNWLVPFVKERKTKLDLSLAKEGGEEAFDEDQYEDKQNNE